MRLEETIEYSISTFGREHGVPDDLFEQPITELAEPDTLVVAPVVRMRPPEWVAEQLEASHRADEELAVDEQSGDRVSQEELGLPTVVAYDEIRIEHATLPIPTTTLGAGSPQTLVHNLAFYVPFHFYPKAWGIYIRESGLTTLAAGLKAEAGGTASYSDDEWIELAHAVLYKHEQFHFITEVAVARAEMLVRDRVYENDYFGNPWAAGLEEALANAYAYRLLPRSITEARPAVFSWMKAQGSGYNEFHRFIGQRSFGIGKRRASQLFSPSVGPYPMRSPAPPTEFIFDVRTQGYQVPLRIVRDRLLHGVSLLRHFPKDFGMKIEAPVHDHEPAHVHIKSPPDAQATRYTWRQLEPLPGERKLSSSERRCLKKYERKYGDDIDKKVQRQRPS